MAFSRIACFLSLALASLTIAAPVSAEKRQVQCVSGLYIIAARGSGEPAGIGRLQEVSDGIIARVPGSVAVGVDYPAELDFDYNDSVEEGEMATRMLIQNYANSCPDGRIALLGYSQGANVVANVIAGSGTGVKPLPKRFKPFIRGVALFGDPTQNPDEKFNRGTAPDGRGLLVRTLFGSLPKLRTYANVLRSWCDVGDAVCASNKPPFQGEVHSNEVANNAAAAIDFISSKA